MSTIGLVQTSDTGQVNWTTATKPGSNTTTDYEIWRFNDSLQGTAPIFIKLFYGTGVSTSYPAMKIQVGTGSNGSGTLTGLTSTESFMCYVSNNIGGVSLNNYACHTDGIAFLVYNVGEAPDRFFFAIGRSCDNTGAPTTHGAVVFTHNNSNSTGYRFYTEALRFTATATKYTQNGGSADGNNYFNLPGAETDTSVGGDTQSTVCIAPFPDFKPVGCFGVALLSELSIGSTAAISYFGGSSPSTYIQLGSGFGCTGSRVNVGDDQGVGLLALWE